MYNLRTENQAVLGVFFSYIASQFLTASRTASLVPVPYKIYDVQEAKQQVPERPYNDPFVFHRFFYPLQASHECFVFHQFAGSVGIIW